MHAQLLQPPLMRLQQLLVARMTAYHHTGAAPPIRRCCISMLLNSCEALRLGIMGSACHAHRCCSRVVPFTPASAALPHLVSRMPLRLQS